MKNKLYDVAHYLQPIPIGVKVFWYPNGRKDVSTIPRIGFVQQGFSRGVADLNVLPAQDGAVEYLVSVPHIGDPRVFDHTGNLSDMARVRGCWEFHPETLALMGLVQPAEEAPARTKNEKATAKA